jgi:hypothetical protein
MGGKSTLHSAVLSQQKTKQDSSAFNLRSWQGLTEVLKVGKESLKDAQAYADFRNLVLEYAQKGGDVELRRKIDATIASFSKKQEQPTAYIPPNLPTETKKLVVNVPTFSNTPNIQTPPIAEPLPVTAIESSSAQGKTSADSNESLVATTRRLQPRFETTVGQPLQSAPIPQPPTPQEIPLQQVQTPTPESLLTQTQHSVDPYDFPGDEIEIVPQQSVPTIQTPAEVSAPNAVSAPFKTIEEHKARISEIKRLVHERMGNPAALIDSHNTVGKQYMQALLTALKATGSGSAVGIDSAMLRLEEVFETLMQDTPEIQEVEKPIVIIRSTPSAVPPPAKVPSVPQQSVAELFVAPVPPTPFIPKDTSAEIPETNISEQTMQSEVAPLANDIPEYGEHTEPEPIIETAPEIPPATTLKEEYYVPPQTPVPTPVSKYSAAQTLASVHTYEVEALPSDTIIQNHQSVPPPTTHTENPYTKLNTEPQTKTNEPRANDVNQTLPNQGGTAPSFTAIQQAELFTPQITEALHQLLSEWSIFGGSGLFGTGPGGSEHPLYHSLSQLSMGEVTAGRWEGTNPKTLKIIKQYVDAWRHEQGIAYTINETFEHYLRRVIQRILKRQNI